MTAAKWKRVRRGAQLLGLVLFVLIVAKLDMGRVVGALVGLSPGYLAAYVALFVALVMLQVVRLRRAMVLLGVPVSFAQAYHCTVEAVFLGTVTPSRAGEFVKVTLLREAGVDMTRGFVFVLFERMVDTAIYLVFATIGLLYFVDSLFPGLRGRLPLLALACVLFLAALWYGRGLSREAAGRVWRAVAASRIGAWLGRLPDFRSEAGRSFKLLWRVLTGFSLAIVVFRAVHFYLLTLAFGLTVDPIHATFAYMASTMVALLPVTVNGIGTREAAYLFLLGLSGVPAETAVLLSLLDGLIFPIVFSSALTVPIWFAKHSRQAG